MFAQDVAFAATPSARYLRVSSSVSAGRSGGRSGLLKRGSDLAIGLAIALIAVPVIVLAWVAVKLTSSGPGFYSQLRVGRNGRTYRIYKIRTMYVNCEAATGAQWSTKGDNRITSIGRIFRKLHVDELPQLLNVLRGDMSLVGPRPERPEFVGPLAAAIPGYEERLAVRPGVTGLAQIQLPPDTDLESVRKKLILDRCYVHSAGLWLDMRIMLGTAVYLVGVSYASVRRLLALPNPLATSAEVDEPTAKQLLEHSKQGHGTCDHVLAYCHVPSQPVACGEAQ